MSSSQQSSVSFAGTALGSVLTITASSGSASTTDVTSSTSTVTSGKVYRQLDCTAIDPGSVSVTVLGGGLTVGAVGTVTASFPGASPISGSAVVSKSETTASVGDLLKSTIEFQFL